MAKNKTDKGILSGLDFNAEDPFLNNMNDNNGEKDPVSMVSVDTLVSYHNHIFKQQSIEKIEELAESIQQVGILNPLLVRPIENGGLEILSGHTRLAAAKHIGLTEVPCYIKECDDEDADTIMVDSNLQRESLSFSEKAWGYRVKKEALDRKNLKNGHGDKVDSAEELARSLNEKRRTVYRYIRLTYLIPKFLEMVDNKKMPAMTVGLDLSYLSNTEQQAVLDFIEASNLKIKPAQSKELKAKHDELAGAGKELDDEVIAEILKDEPKVKVTNVVFKTDLRDFFPYETSDEEIENTVIKLLTKWKEEKRDE